MTKKKDIADEPVDQSTAPADDADTSDSGESAPYRPAEPKPGAPDYDWSAHYGTDDLYRHTFADGTVVALKPFGSIYSKTWLYKIRNMVTDVDVQFASIDRASCETARAVLESLDDTVGDPLDDLFTAWVAAGTQHADGDEGLTSGK